jgi:hypothetical protein
MQLDHSQYLYQSNIHAFQQMRIGLEDSQQTEEELLKCIKHINKNAKADESGANPKKDAELKIVNGLKILKSSKNEKLLSQEGAHS